MKQEGLMYFTDTYLTVLGLMIFLGYFVVILIKATKTSKEHLDYLQNIPFQKNNEEKL